MFKNQKGLLIILIVIGIFSFIFINMMSKSDYQEYSGSNLNGSISFSVNDGLYNFEFKPSEFIAKDHIKSDWYIFDFYTVDKNRKINCALNLFTEKMENKVVSRFNNNIIKLDFERVEITTKNGVFVIPLARNKN